MSIEGQLSAGIGPEVLENLDLFFYSWDPRAVPPVFIYWNPSLLLSTGYSLESFQDPRFWLSLISPEDRGTVEEMRERLSHGEKCHSQYRILTRSRKTLWLTHSAIPTLQNGKVIRIQGVIQDITASQEPSSLKESEDCFQALFESAKEAAFLFEWEENRRFGHLLEVNQAACQLLGYSRQELLAMNPRQWISSEELPGGKAALFPRGPTMDAEWDLITKDGKRIPFESRWICFEWLGKPVVLGIEHPLTEHGQAEDRLQRQNSYLEALAEMALGVINQLDLEDLLEAILMRACRWTGTEHGYIYLVDAREESVELKVGSGLYAPCVGYRVGKGEDMAGTVWQTGESLLVEDYSHWSRRSPVFSGVDSRASLSLPLVSRDRVVGVIGMAYMTPGRTFSPEETEFLGRFAHLASIALENARLFAQAERELADRRRTEQELRNSQHFTQHILEATPNILYIVDLKTGRNEYANREFFGTLGYTPEEMQTLSSDSTPSLIHPEDVARVVQHYEDFAAAREDEVREIEYRVRHRDGRWRRIHSHELVFSRDEEGHPREILGAAEDVTERQAAVEALRQSELRYRVLFGAAKRQALELSLLDQVKAAVEREMDLQVVFRTVVEAIVKAFGYTHVSLYLMDAGVLRLQHQIGYEHVLSEIPIEKGISGQVARSGKPFLLEDVSMDARFLPAVPGIRSEVCVPLFDQGKIAGILNVESKGDMLLGEADLHILTLLAEDVGLAISKARLYEASRASEERQRKRAEELQALYQTSLEINMQRNLIDLLQAIVRRVTDLLGVRMGGLCLVHDQSLEQMVGYNLPEGLLGIHLQVGEGLFGKILETAQPMMIADYQAWKGRAGVFSSYPFRRALGAPMKVGERVIGILEIADDSHIGPFSEEEVRLLSMFADQATLAVENSRLYGELKHELFERRLVEQALSRSEERYRTLIESQEEGVVEMDLEKTFLFANPSADRILGVERGGLVGRNLGEFTISADLESALPTMETRHPGKSGHCHLWVRRPNDDKRLLRVTALPRQDREERPIGVVGVFEDITEQRQIEVERERLASFAELNPAPILEVTADGRVQYQNRVTRERFPRLEELGIKHPFLSGFPSVASLMREQGLTFLVRDVKVNGALFQQAIHTVENGTLMRVYGLDLTEQKRAEEALRVSEQRYRLLVERNLAGVFRSTPDGRLLDCNDSFAHILGYDSREDVCAQPAAFFYEHPEERAKIISRLMAEGFLTNIEFAIRRRDGKLVWLLENTTLIVGETEMPIILQGTVIDITERKEAQRELEESFGKLRQTLSETVQALASVGEMKDPYTAGHQLHVSQLGSAIARELGLDEDHVEGIRVGGLVHDLGKLYVPTEILSKPGKLSPLEMSMIQMHAQAGYEVLKSIQFPWPVAQMALQHHERMNGSGYPNRLTGPQILLEARILAVADVVEAMANHRPYRPALGVRKALEEVQRGRGEQFDPEVVDACSLLFREKGFQFQ